MSDHTNFRLAVVGSRDFGSQSLVEQVVYHLPKHITLVTGGARGVDKWAEETARYWNRPVIVYPAQWNKHGKMAGFIRNNEIVNNCDGVLAFWDGKSKGTKHTIALARYRCKPLIIMRWQG